MGHMVKIAPMTRAARQRVRNHILHFAKAEDGVMLALVMSILLIMMIVAASAIFAWILTANQVANLFAQQLLGLTEDPTMILLIIMGIVLFVGCFMETIAAITILTPVLLPVAMQIGIDPVHFGVILILNLMIGLLTPPVGMVLYVLSKVAAVPFERCVIATAPFLVPLICVLLLLSFVPSLSMWLPIYLYR